MSPQIVCAILSFSAGFKFLEIDVSEIVIESPPPEMHKGSIIENPFIR